MKTLKRVLSVVLATFLSGSLEAHSCKSPVFGRNDKPIVQVAILLDTSNSMDGLIEQAKSQLWRVANDLAYSTRCGVRPTLEVALYEYGNDRLSQGEGYVRQVLPFTTDMDLVSQKLFALTTKGGQEYCGVVIKDAVQNLRWNTRDDVYKTIFIAGNEPFTQGPVYFRDSITQASRKGITVNTIFCGAHAEGMQTQWYDGAMIGKGSYLTIDQNRVVAVDPTPYDDEIAQLGGQLNQTYIGYGSRGREAMKSTAKADYLAESLPMASGAVAERSLMKASGQYSGADWDVVSSVSKGEQKVSALKRTDLPTELQRKSNEELEAHMKDQNKKRESIQGRLGDLKAKRDQHLAKNRKATDSLSLDQAMQNAIREQAGRLEYKFDAPSR